MTTQQQGPTPAPSGGSAKEFTFDPNGGGGTGASPFATDPSQGVAAYNPNATITNQNRPLPGYHYTYGNGSATAAEHGQQQPPVRVGDALQQLLIDAVSNPDAITELQVSLIRGGYLNPKSRTFLPGDVQPGDATYLAYNKLLEKSVRTGKPYQDILNADVGRNAGGAAYNYFVKKFGPNGELALGGPDMSLRKIDITQTDIPTQGTAESALRSTLQQLWGRNPTDEEISHFSGLLQSYAAGHPQHTTGTYDPMLGVRGDRDTTTTGGLSSGDVESLARQFAMAQGGNEQQAAGHAINQYMQMFESALKGGG